jgi:hypothetical protein
MLQLVARLLWPEGDDLTDRLDWTSRNRRLPTESNKEPHCALFRRFLQRLYFPRVVIFIRSMFHIRDIFIRVRILGSVHWITDPDTEPFSGFQDAHKNVLF